MYNRYLDRQQLTELAREPEANRAAADEHGPEDARCPPPSPGELAGGLSQLLSGVKRHFSLSQLDTGDILLVLIILLLYLEGDSLELVITLGLMLLLGLGEE